MNLRGPNDWTPLRRQRVHRRPAAGFIMKVGLFVALEHEAHDNVIEHLRNLKEQVRTAKEAGFDSIWLPQHFITGPSMRQSAASPMLGYLAGVAEGMRLGTAVLLLPMLNPVLLAEEAATLDQLTDGKFVLGVGLGYRDSEFAPSASSRTIVSSSATKPMFATNCNDIAMRSAPTSFVSAWVGRSYRRRRCWRVFDACDG